MESWGCADFFIFAACERPHQVISLISFSFLEGCIFPSASGKNVFISKIIDMCFVPFPRCCSTSWTQLSSTALRRGKVSSCLDRLTLKATIPKASPASSSLRCTCKCMFEYFFTLSLLTSPFVHYSPALSLHPSLWFHYLLHFLS